MSDQVQLVQELLDHLTSPEIGGRFHSALRPCLDPDTGLSIASTSTIPAGEILISCPFDYAITPNIAKSAILDVSSSTEEFLNGWNERMLIGAYICLHWIYQSKLPQALRHRHYVAALPESSTLRTPLHFTDQELSLLNGTNLLGATQDRKALWQEEYARIKSVIGDEVTWEQYLAAATYISSRAFPSKLLRIPESGQQTSSAVDTSEEEESHPVLLPGVDMLNHARGQPITWLSSPLSSSSNYSASSSVPSISLVTPVDLEGNKQVFNNYGPKPNEELLLGYGFVLDANPDDVVVLRLGGLSKGLSHVKTAAFEQKGLDVGKRWIVRRDGEMDKGLMEVMRILMADDTTLEASEAQAAHGHGHEHDSGDDDDEDEHDHGKWEEEMGLEMDVLEALGQMMDDKLAKLDIDLDEVEARDDVRRMCAIYRQGQVDILEAAMAKLEERIERVENFLNEGPGCACHS